MYLYNFLKGLINLTVISITLFSCYHKKKEVPPFSISPSHQIQITGNINNTTITGVSYIINNTTQSLNLKWKKIKSTCPADWNIYFCDNVACHFIFPDSVSLNPILPNNDISNARMKLFIEHNEIKGKGDITIKVTDKKHSYSDEITYSIVIK